MTEQDEALDHVDGVSFASDQSPIPLPTMLDSASEEMGQTSFHDMSSTDEKDLKDWTPFECVPLATVFFLKPMYIR